MILTRQIFLRRLILPIGKRTSPQSLQNVLCIQSTLTHEGNKELVTSLLLRECCRTLPMKMENWIKLLMTTEQVYDGFSSCLKKLMGILCILISTSMKVIIY